MPTNRERRGVAARLRELVADWFDNGEFYDRGEVEDVLGLATDDGAWYEAVGVRRLADLIEPEERTCRMTVLENARGNPKYFLMYVCSECHGAVVHDRYDPIYYCPNCGARVVSE